MEEHYRSLKEKVDKHDQDLYFGDQRKPGLTTRIELMEDSLDGIRRNLGKIVWLLVGLLMTGVGDIVARHI